METATIESVAKWWDNRPCNVAHGDAPIGSEEWSRQVSERKYFVEPHIREFAQFERWSHKWVMEVGCGIGSDTLEFLKAGATVIAVDVSVESIEIAMMRVKDYLGSTAVFFNHDAESWLPAPDNAFDLIYSFGVLHHTPHPRRVLANAYRRLKPGGELRIMLYAKWSLKNLFGGQYEAQAGCPIVRKYTIEEAELMLMSEGFYVESIKKAFIFPYRVKDYIEHRYVKRLVFRLMPKRFFRWLETKLGEHLLIVARKGKACSESA